MASGALKRWQGEGQHELDELETAHKSVGGAGRGRRWATRQLNYAYALLVAAQFQRYCRDLHSEAVDALADAAGPSMGAVLRAALLKNRRLDKGNASPSAIGADFDFLGTSKIWDAAKSVDVRTKGRQDALEELNSYRNAIAHHDFSKVKPGLRLAKVVRWRRACDGLAATLDVAVSQQVQVVTNKAPW
ncbi:MAG: hypothetical protein HY904_02940 [Deltaproteobacteria bacterium]|nr:hypothetical protein [Deltaproteobacteria bacterium]